ncbi:organic hydroperoxide resistance protein [Acinetobacter sp. ANC 4779]|uniref:organic hydroperoxide resistance protein n=1 Tax=Acinetobacter sp. ANC 4779 TaxID=2529848 RepID=UPI00103E7AFD|nr:organic hydroperoxide resistance protein [Acinetobacter sp. ANC 4779]TCB47707.1 organic hydroperoxide resistance protein [Acinetobacter sp. ANC 4779]
MSTLYSTKVKAIGGRSGTIHSEDGILELNLALPKELGGRGGETNPEQLFAAGYAACFGNAIIHVSRNKQHKIHDNDVEVLSTVGMVANGNGGFALTVNLDVTISGISQTEAEQIVEETHQVCPYSNAIRGNIQVSTTVHTK